MTYFETIENIKDITSLYHDVIDKRTGLAQAIGGASGNNFTGKITIDYESDGNDWVNLAESSFNMGVILRNGWWDAGGHVMPPQSNVALAYNFPATAFSRIQHLINGKLVCETEVEPVITESYIYRTTKNRHWGNTSSGSVKWLEDYDTRLKRTIGSDILDPNKRVQHPGTTAINYDLTNPATAIYANAWQRVNNDASYIPICLPTFREKKLYPPGSKHSFVFHVHSDWAYRMIEGIDINTCAVSTNGLVETYTQPVIPNLGFTGDGTIANRYIRDHSLDSMNKLIDLTITNFDFTPQIYKGAMMPKQPIYYTLMNYNTERRNLTSSLNQTLLFTVDPRLSKVAIFFQSKKWVNLSPNHTLSTFTSHLNNDETYLNGFSFRLGNRTFPEPEAQFNMLAGGLELTVSKEYKTTMNNNMATLSESGLESMNEWLKGPYFQYVLAHADEHELNDNVLHVTLKFTQPPTNMCVHLVTEYNSRLELNYNDSGLRGTSVE